MVSDGSLAGGEKVPPLGGPGSLGDCSESQGTRLCFPHTVLSMLGSKANERGILLSFKLGRNYGKNKFSFLETTFLDGVIYPERAFSVST